MQLYCDHGEKGIIGGWYGGPLNGSEPRPVSRTYWFHNTSAAPVTYTASLLCVGSRLVRGVKIAKSATHERCNYLGGVESPAETEYLNHDEECLLVKQGNSDNYDAEANQTLAKNLKGKLLLAHGTLDDNVPPDNTYLVVDALIKAGKDFDLLMIPNAAHGFGAASNYMMRRRWDYFVQHLMGATPPKEYQIGPK